MTYNKHMTIQHCINPAMLPIHEVRYHCDTKIVFEVGCVLFFDAHGGHWVGDDRHHHFVAIYHPDHGQLLTLLNLTLVQSIWLIEPDEGAEEPETVDGAA